MLRRLSSWPVTPHFGEISARHDVRIPTALTWSSENAAVFRDVTRRPWFGLPSLTPHSDLSISRLRSAWDPTKVSLNRGARMVRPRRACIIEGQGLPCPRQCSCYLELLMQVPSLRSTPFPPHVIQDSSHWMVNKWATWKSTVASRCDPQLAPD
ncbi:hypothetical protein N657DRAFT_467443 [Parathielavia appendiculata]|uniref:Uncharacterized protein n=1 Tax=Parathielavia appendiculata TaxID=2587402 RepID=A0AAN6TXF9_9PEZI|nr:hypothetical protein N657DRAFT_467443 [Parathielavia appendiculata]